MSEHSEATTPASPSIDNSAQETAPTLAGADLATARDWLIAANPDVVPELVAGDSISALQASIDPARAAYQRIAAAARSSAASGSTTDPPATPAAPRVPAGTAPAVVDVEHLSSAEKIRRGLATKRR